MTQPNPTDEQIKEDAAEHEKPLDSSEREPTIESQEKTSRVCWQKYWEAGENAHILKDYHQTQEFSSDLPTELATTDARNQKYEKLDDTQTDSQEEKRKVVEEKTQLLLLQAYYDLAIFQTEVYGGINSVLAGFGAVESATDTVAEARALRQRLDNYDRVILRYDAYAKSTNALIEFYTLQYGPQAEAFVAKLNDMLYTFLGESKDDMPDTLDKGSDKLYWNKASNLVKGLSVSHLQKWVEGATARLEAAQAADEQEAREDVKKTGGVEAAGGAGEAAVEPAPASEATPIPVPVQASASSSPGHHLDDEAAAVRKEAAALSKEKSGDEPEQQSNTSQAPDNEQEG